MTLSKVFFFLVLSFIGGILISSFFNISKLILIEFFLLGFLYFILSFFFTKNFKKVLIIFALCLVFFSLGILRLELTDSSGFNQEGTLEVLEGLRGNLKEKIYNSFSPPESNILAALTLGYKGEIGENWKEKLNISGLRHVVAISGMHIIILSGVIVSFCLSLGIPRGKVFYFALIILWFFIALTGFQTSALRAGIMGSMLLFCNKLGRQRRADRALFLTAALILMVNPTLLKESIGFQLSFAASLGIIYFRPFLSKFFEKIKIFNLIGANDLLAVTFSAQIFVFPLLIYHFGKVSLISPLSNILVVPLIPLLMILGMVFLATSLISPIFSFIIYLPTCLFLNYLAGVVDIFSRLPLAQISFYFPWFLIPASYLILGFIAYKISQRSAFLSF